MVPKDIIVHVDLRELTLDEVELVADDAWCMCLSRAIVSAESKVASMCESIKSIVDKRREVKSEVARLSSNAKATMKRGRGLYLRLTSKCLIYCGILTRARMSCTGCLMRSELLLRLWN